MLVKVCKLISERFGREHQLFVITDKSLCYQPSINHKPLSTVKSVKLLRLFDV